MMRTLGQVFPSTRNQPASKSGCGETLPLARWRSGRCRWPTPGVMRTPTPAARSATAATATEVGTAYDVNNVGGGGLEAAKKIPTPHILCSSVQLLGSTSKKREIPPLGSGDFPQQQPFPNLIRFNRRGKVWRLGTRGDIVCSILLTSVRNTLARAFPTTLQNEAVTTFLVVSRLNDSCFGVFWQSGSPKK